MNEYKEIEAQTERVAKEVVDAAFQVHSTLGPGLLESVYEACMVREFELRRLAFRQQIPVPIEYRGAELEVGFRLDLDVEERLIVELKAVDSVRPIHKAQLLTYLKLTGRRLGLLINFNLS